MPDDNTVSYSTPSSQRDFLKNPLPQTDGTQQLSCDKDKPLGTSATGSDWVVPTLAFTLTAGFFALLFVLCFHTVPDPNLAMLNIVLGSLGTAWIGAMAYFFGSSRGNQAKDWMLYRSQLLDQQSRR